jgi:hypothetical protein
MTSKETTTIASDQPGNDEILVWVGGPDLGHSLPSSGRLFIVEAEPERVNEVWHLLGERAEVHVCEEVLVAESNATVQWHCFNDSRLNGPSQLTLWQQRFPNLRQIDEKQRYGRRLGDLLDHWVQCQGDWSLTKLNLFLRQGDPLAALEGLGHWTSRVQMVELTLPWPEDTIKTTEAWLAEHGFLQDPKIATIWNRDSIATRDWLLKESEKEKLVLIEANEKLHKECEALHAQNVDLSSKLEKRNAHLLELSNAQKLTESNIHQSQVEIDKLRSQQTILEQECQQLTREKTDLLAQLEAANAEAIHYRAALGNLLPIDRYRDENHDLYNLNEESLILHYLQYGQYEGRLKSYEELNSDWKNSVEACQQAQSKLMSLEAQFDQTQQQLETMKDLFVRLADRQVMLAQADEK